ncbi:S1C family serine protease [Armatimonas rosea]|uniref:S1-C subfamily serine protease n=1 Tax=Armatimonas rosea TaxID=685828 RepID=A0A7W9W4Q1_ARMRO|nr:S1C family serine protease [Armatimonas rosea]MBB6049639.1 S1-C subfamily serine protease [Armatimonas rosea]
MSNELTSFSDSLAALVRTAGASVVRVDDGTRLTASGLIWEPGVIVTTSHGTERDDELFVITHDGTRLPAQLIGRDPETDLAALRVGAELSPIARPAESFEPQLGQLALAVSRPGDYGLVATLGLVASVQPTQTAGTPEYIVSTDADLYPGSSGGALLATDGTLIGLLNRGFGRGLGVALGTPLVARVVASLLQHGRVPRGYLGVKMQHVALPDSLRVTHSLAQESGLLVIHVEPGSAAEQAGVLMGDTLISLDGAPLDDVAGIRERLAAGRAFTLDVLRGGQRHTFSGTAAASPA